MGTTKVKIIDLSSENQSVKASQKHAQSLGSASKIKKDKGSEHSAKSENQKISAPENQNIEESETPKISESSDSLTTRHSESSEFSEPKKQIKKSKIPKKQKRHLGKKYKEAATKIEKDKIYPAAEALDLLAKTSFTKFDPSVEIHLGLNVKSARGTVNFPHTTGPKKERKYLVFSAKKVEGNKNIIWANEDNIADLESGKLKPNRDFSVVIASPKFMPVLAKVAKILGPAGMMPNPKNGTITENPLDAIEQSSTSGTPYQTDPTAPIIHSKLGKLSEKPEDLKENLKALVVAVGPSKIKKATLASTMSPGIKVDISTL